MRNVDRIFVRTIALAATLIGVTQPSEAQQLSPHDMKKVGTIDERFQSYNIEMLEVTGGDFWKPYKAETAPKNSPVRKQSTSSVPVGMNANMYQYRPPIDLGNIRRRKLAAALGPAYVRVSGTWANNTYFHDSDTPPPHAPPKGFSGVLTRRQWKGVVDFAQAANAEIVTSFTTSPGVRDASGTWTPDQGRRFLAYTKKVGGHIAATEFMNEPTAAEMGGAPKGYDGAWYGRDTKVFRDFIKHASPDTIFLGPGSVGEGGTFSLPLGASFIKSTSLLTGSGDAFDVFSYHFYGAASERCAAMGADSQTKASEALSEEWLSRTEAVEEFYSKLRDRFVPGKKLWITETADAACGGNPWASTFADSFRYLNQLGQLAKRNVQVVMHNTLDSSDYGLLDESTFEPRPNYWAALLWRSLMGTTVLEVGVDLDPNLHIYSHCLRGSKGGVVLLVINTDQKNDHTLTVPVGSSRYTLSATNLFSKQVSLNGKTLALGGGDALPEITGIPVTAGEINFHSASITFLAVPGANNAACAIN